MQPVFFRQEFFFGLYIIRVWHTAIYRANCCALWLLVKARALRTLTWNDVVEFIRYRFLICFTINNRTILHFNLGQICSIRPFPFHTAFIDGRVWTLRFTSPAVYTFIRNCYCHNAELIISYAKLLTNKFAAKVSPQAK